MIYFDDVIKITMDFMKDYFPEYDEGLGELLYQELEQKRWVSFDLGTIEKQVSDICAYLTVDSILRAIREERLNEYIKDVQSNICGIADTKRRGNDE